MDDVPLRLGYQAGQERVLAICLRRPFFDELLIGCVASSFNPLTWSSHEEWKSAVGASDVRMQWDPDHHPCGAPLERRALQLGLRGRMLRRYASEELTRIVDITEFVTEQSQRATGDLNRLVIPEEHVYTPESSLARERSGIIDAGVGA